MQHILSCLCWVSSDLKYMASKQEHKTDEPENKRGHMLYFVSQHSSKIPRVVEMLSADIKLKMHHS